MKKSKFATEAGIMFDNASKYLTYGPQDLKTQIEERQGELFRENRYSIMLEHEGDGYILVLNQPTGRKALKKFKKILQEMAKKA